MSEGQVQLPSYETMFRLKPNAECFMNIHSSRTLVSIFKVLLMNLSREDKLSLTTEEWLLKISRDARFTAPDESMIIINMNGTELTFRVDDRLSMSINKLGSFIGLYHYTLTCSTEEHSIIMRRLRISDCFTIPYNSTLMKAFGEKMEIIPIYSIHEYWEFHDKYLEIQPKLEDTEISSFIETHALVSLVELYALTDNKRIKDVNSVATEYISAYEKNKPKFKKVPTPTETSYELPGFGYFEKLSSNILRHFGRMNAEFLLLAETSLYYDAMSKTDGLEIFNIYKDKIQKVPNGTITGVYDQIFPMYILCDNKQVLKLRKKRKCLQIPHFTTLSDEEKYGRILLYFPIRPGQNIDMERLG